MPSDFWRKLRLNWGDKMTRVRGDWTAIAWKDKWNVNMLTNMHRPPAEGNFCDENRKVMKPAIVQDYNRHTGYADKNACMMNTYSISTCTWKWMEQLFLSPSGSFNSEQLYSPNFLSFKINSSKFQACLGQRPFIRGGEGDSTTDHPTWQTNYLISQVPRLDIWHNTGPQKEVELTATCVLWQIKKCEQNLAVWNVCGAVCWSLL
jgi:hypothetical protein